ncbi:Cytochrome b561 and DOMON domain-containing protein [Camellia lanceoleosa]|uniref:Cytochrome b561 and DOMON domain-containing protein n=1 Tax=Camellia lanceoleosa TaxID=1840588 RepID=A0ACC0GL56_9ERIC|nr:Cytochrome b561 and DOMON domain-containing protein [Camellia lanceoleosa]
MNMKLLIAVLIFFLFSAAADSCADFMFPNNKVFTSCTNLSALNSFLYWSQNPSSTTLDMAYRHSQVSPSTWVAWGINPKPNKMVGTQAIIAYQKTDGNMAVYTSSVDSYATQLQEGNLSFPVSDLSALFSNDEIIIFATIQLPNNSSTINHVWQDGPITGNHLGIHDLSGHHLQSMGTLNLLSGQAIASHGSDSKTKLKISHGVLNTISWGIMMPIGLLVARYLKAVGPTADPLWFYLHIVVQLSAYIMGLAGGATGFLLLSKSSGIHHPCHLGIGIILFPWTTSGITALCSTNLYNNSRLFVSALLLRPSKDHKYRYLWNLFHHNTGYAVILLSFFNIWLGFSILKPERMDDHIWCCVRGIDIICIAP